MIEDLWEVRTLPGGLSSGLRGGDKPGLVLVQGSDRAIVELAHVKAVHSYGASRPTPLRVGD